MDDVIIKACISVVLGDVHLRMSTRVCFAARKHSMQVKTVWSLESL